MRAGGDGASDLLHRWDGRIPRGATSATEGTGGGGLSSNVWSLLSGCRRENTFFIFDGGFPHRGLKDYLLRLSTTSRRRNPSDAATTLTIAYIYI